MPLFSLLSPHRPVHQPTIIGCSSTPPIRCLCSRQTGEDRDYITEAPPRLIYWRPGELCLQRIAAGYFPRSPSFNRDGYQYMHMMLL